MADEDLLINAGFSASKLAQSAQEVIATAKRTGEQAQKVFNDATSRVTNTEAARANTRALERMAQAYDPVYRAEVRHKKSLDDLNKLLSSGKYTQDQYNAALKRSEDQLRKAGDAAQELGRKGLQGGTGWQNIGFQVGDFATQVGAGTSAVQAAGQQLPQLLGGLGTMGALMGAGAAIAIPLGAALLKVAMDTETLDDKLESLEKTTNAYLDAVDAQATPLEQLRVQYGELADEIQRANDATASLTQFSARRDLIGSANKFGETSFGASSWWSNVVGAAQQEAGAQESDVERLARVYKISAEQAERLQMARRRLETSNSEAAVARDAEHLRDVLLDIAGNAESAAEKFPEELAKTDLLIRTAADQIAAADRAHRQAQQDLLETYDSNTQKLKKLADERTLAEESQAEAVKKGKTDQAEAYGRVIRAIDKEVAAVKQSIAEMDGTFEASVARMKEMAAGLGGALSGAIKGWTGMSPTEWTDAGTASQKGILDLIAQRESGGDYNAAWGGTKFTGGNLSLVNMTLNEILAVQKQMLAHPENTANSSALGRYQIVGTTLRGLMKELGLSGDELFSTEMQDRLASQLVRRRLPQGVEGLRNEWEGLRNVPPALIQQALNQQSIDRVDPEIARERKKTLDDEIRDRERLQKQAVEYGRALSANLMTEQQRGEITKQQAEQVAAIRASGMSDADQATAIAAVNAEAEKQMVIFALMEDAKRRQVDLDAMLADGSMTYRQAIESLGEAKRQSIVSDQEMQDSAQRIAEASERGQSALESMFGSIIDGSMSGKEALKQLLLEIARVQAMKAIMSFPGVGAASSVIGGLLSFDGGGFTGIGSRSGGIDGKGGFPAILHPNETVLDHTRGQRVGSFAPVTNITISGNADQQTLAQLRRELDMRDRRLAQQVPSIMDNHQKRRG